MKPLAPISKPRRRLLLLAGRWLIWGLLAMLAMVLVAYFSRLSLTNYALRTFFPKLPSKVKSLDWEDGGLVIKGVVVGEFPGHKPMLSLPTVRVNWSSSHSMGKVILESPEVSLSPESFLAFSDPDPPSTAAKSTGPSAGFSLEGIEVKAGRLTYTDGGRSWSGDLNWTGGGVILQPDGALAMQRQKISVSGLAGDNVAGLPPITVECSVDPVTHRLTVHQLSLAEAGEIRLGADVMAQFTQPGALVVTPAAPSAAVVRAPVEAFALESADVKQLRVSVASIPGFEKAGTLAASISLQAKQTADGHSAVEWQIRDASLGSVAKLTAVSGAVEELEDGWHVKNAALSESTVLVDAAAWAQLGLPGKWDGSFQGTISAEMPDFLLTTAGMAQPNKVTAHITKASLRGPRNEPLARWERLTVSADPNQLMSTGVVQQVRLEKPQIQLTGKLLAWLNTIAGSSSSTVPLVSAAAAASTAPAPESPQLWRAEDLSVVDGHISATSLGDGVPDLKAGISLTTAPLRDGGEPMYRLELHNPQVGHPTDPLAPPIYQGQTVLLAAHPERLWTHQSIEQVHFAESRLDIGAKPEDAYMISLPGDASRQVRAVVHPPKVKASGLEPGEAAADVYPDGWHIRNLSFQNTRVHLHRLLPDCPEIVLPVSYSTFHDVPLNAEALSKREDALRLEVPMLHLPGTRAGTSVADLDTNFLHFRLAGLMNREIDRIQLVNPKIYVGDSLFHYVDKMRKESEGPDPLKAGVAKLALAIFAQLGGDLADGGDAAKDKGWTVKKLQAVNGKLVTTVKDSPLIRVPPLPFGAETSMQDSEINAELAIPAGIYKPILGLELVAALEGGSIKFNLPRKEKRNNLVQVFKATWLRYKQVRLSEVKLAVTYDEFGIYAQFWAKAYGGYLRGEFNLYLTDNMGWDGWIAATDVDTTELTKLLTPNYFTMQGRINAELIAQGDKTSLYQATGKLSTDTGGLVKILALEDIIKAIPQEWQEVQRKYTIKALETVRDFRYDKCEGDLRFYGIEGSLNLHLKGPDGQRNFQVTSHDRR